MMKLSEFFQKQNEQEKKLYQEARAAATDPNQPLRRPPWTSSVGLGGGVAMDLVPSRNITDSGISALTNDSSYCSEEDEESVDKAGGGKRWCFTRRSGNSNSAEGTADEFDDLEETAPTTTTGSSILGATFNLTNGIVGAGVIGLGGAMAVSGGLISIVYIIFFAILTKLSLDLLIDLTIRNSSNGVGSYEELGKAAYGTFGRLMVLTTKFLYSFGGLVAFVVIVRENFGSGLRRLIYHDDDSSSSPTSGFESFLQKDDILVVLLASFIILPLSLLRDMTPLAKFSIFSVLTFVGIVMIIVVIYFMNPGDEVRLDGGTVGENWFKIKTDMFESLGTFVLLYVCQNYAHLTYESLDPKIRNIKTWKKVSTYSLSLAGVISLVVGIFVYITFWQKAKDNIFEMYPALPAIDISKILLCVTMLLTFPLPFFTCREIVVLVALDCFSVCGGGRNNGGRGSANMDNMSQQLRAPLLTLEEGNEWDENGVGVDEGPKIKGLSKEEVGSGAPGMFEDILAQPSVVHQQQPAWLIPGEGRQLTTTYHVVVTISLLSVITTLAILAPSLGDVLDLVGCATGSVIGFVLPALFSFKLDGYSHLALLIFMVGAVVGVVGTVFSLRKLIQDMA
mmetsp:Transcript_18687/g.27899  ORF Transcript_18687/g.27899 Transcript_18687/m.27899 type:complete len:621 (-) Transcript_18687:676-2538(-)